MAVTATSIAATPMTDTAFDGGREDDEAGELVVAELFAIEVVVELPLGAEVERDGSVSLDEFAVTDVPVDVWFSAVWI